MKTRSLTFALLLSLTSYIFPQAEGAVPFLTIQQSPFLQGAGQTGVAIITNDPIGFYYNPAILGLTARTNHVSLLFLPKKVDWLGFNGISINSYGFNFGYNFDKSIPLSVGAGFIHNNFKYDIYQDESFNSFSIGASLNYPVSLSLGFSLKKFSSTFFGTTMVNPDSIRAYEASGTAYDFGALVNVPVSDLLFKDARYDFSDESFLAPKFNFALGYSLTNLGKEISYSDRNQKDPIPRTAKLGYSFNFGFDYNFNGKNISIFDYTFTAEASDILVQRDSNRNLTYKGLLGDINIWKNLVELKYDNNTIIHKGHIFNLFETIRIAFGNFTGKGYENNPKTNALVFSTDGLFKYFHNADDNSIFGFITGHISIEYTTSTIFAGSGIDTDYKAISLFYKNIVL